MGVILMGPPGSGKGTQAARICAERGWVHVATGDMLRAAMEEGSPTGLKVKSVVENGDLVGDELMLELVAERLGRDDCRKGFVLDGFPRTVRQAEGLLELLPEIGGKSIDKVILLRLPDEVIIERLLGRGRTDDSEETVRHRLDVFRSQTEPVVEYLQSQGMRVSEVDAVGSIEEISERIGRVLDAVD